MEQEHIKQNAQDLLTLIHNTPLTTAQRETLIKGLNNLYELAMMRFTTESVGKPNKVNKKSNGNLQNMD
jgi:hypothetical protein